MTRPAPDTDGVEEHVKRSDRDGPLLSVVVPVYGVEQWLDDCLNSLVAQDVDQEILVVIDASPDDSARIAHEFAARHPSVRVIENPVNVGLGAARNVGLRQARGRYVTFPDSDDMVPPGAYRAMIASLEASGSDFATARADEFGTASGLARYWTTRHQIFDTGITATDLRRNPELVYDHTAWTKVFRRSFVSAAGLTFPESTKCEDVAPAMRAYAEARSVDVVPRSCYLYRRRPGSITTGLASSQTISDWTTQTRLALDTLRSTGNHAALQEFVAKVLFYEFDSRAAIVEELDDGDVRRAAVACLAELLEQAVPGTLRRVRNRTLEAACRLLTGAGSVDGWRDAAAAQDRPVPAALAEVLRLRRRVAPIPAPRTAEGGPVVSVVVPTHDVGPWIDDCLRSVLGQTLRDIEVIVVDDDSSDDTWARVLEWRDRDPRVVALRNRGQGGAQARNFGVEHARGTYLMFADGDDTVPRHAYETLVGLIESTSADVAVGGFQKFGPSSTWSNAKEYGHDRELGATTLDLTPKLIRNRTCWNRVVRRSFWNDHGVHFPTTPRGNDMLPMTTVLRLASSVATTPTVVYNYRARTSGSMTSTLGTLASTVGYFVQERLCAVVLGGDPESELAREYWYMVLGADGWATIGKFLRAGLDDLDPEEVSSVTDAVRSLLSLAPRTVLDRIGPRRALVYHLAAIGDLPASRSVWERETNHFRGSRRDRVVDAVETLITAIESGFDPQLAMRVWRTDVLRPFVERHDGWDDEVASLVMGFVDRFADHLSLDQSATPETREPRVVRALLGGERSDVWRETLPNPYRYRPKLVAEVDHIDGTRLSLRSTREVVDDVTISHLEATGPKGERRRERIFGTMRRDGGEWSIEADLVALSPGLDWSVRAIVHDSQGRLDLPVRLKWPPHVSRTGRLRPMETDDERHSTSLRVFETGTARVTRAIQWRLERRRKQSAHKG